MAGNPRILVVDQDFESRAELQKGLVRSRFIVVGGVGYGAEALSLAAEFRLKLLITGGLAAEFRRRGKTAGIIAVDPSSPFTHGAILGDRIRMQDHALDDGVVPVDFAEVALDLVGEFGSGPFTLRAGLGTLAEGQKISYEEQRDPKRGKTSAENLKAV